MLDSFSSFYKENSLEALETLSSSYGGFKKRLVDISCIDNWKIMEVEVLDAYKKVVKIFHELLYNLSQRLGESPAEKLIKDSAGTPIEDVFVFSKKISDYSCLVALNEVILVLKVVPVSKMVSYSEETEKEYGILFNSLCLLFTCCFIEKLIGGNDNFVSLGKKVVINLLQFLCNCCVKNENNRLVLFTSEVFSSLNCCIEKNKNIFGDSGIEAYLWFVNYLFVSEKNLEIFFTKSSLIRNLISLYDPLNNTTSSIICCIFGKFCESNIFEKVISCESVECSNLLKLWLIYLRNEEVVESNDVKRDFEILYNYLVKDKDGVDKIIVIEILSQLSSVKELNEKVGLESKTMLYILTQVLEELYKEENKSIFGYRKELVRFVGNVVYKNKSLKDAVREFKKGEICGLHLILNAAGYDDNNPYIREWSVFAIRNLCEFNEENQNIISSLREQSKPFLK